MRTPTEHFFPQADADLVPWGDQFNSYMLANFAALGLVAGDFGIEPAVSHA